MDCFENTQAKYSTRAKDIQVAADTTEMFNRNIFLSIQPVKRSALIELEKEPQENGE